MPKVTLLKPQDRDLREQAARTLGMAMARRGVRSKSELARMLDMDEQAVRYRFRTGAWRRDELVKLTRTLRLSREEAASLIGSW